MCLLKLSPDIALEIPETDSDRADAAIGATTICGFSVGRPSGADGADLSYYMLFSRRNLSESLQGCLVGAAAARGDGSGGGSVVADDG